MTEIKPLWAGQKSFLNLCYILYIHISAGVQLGGRGEGLPCPFLKIKKSALILEKKNLKTLYPSIHPWICLSIYLSWVGFFLWKLCPPFVFPYQKSENLVLPFIEKDTTKPMNIPNLLKDYSMFHRKIVCKVISYQQKSV